ncbi:QWRF domain containing 1, SNOWY COTYLEDON 3 [Hibiscus trionum]|uniref:QWRF domain containing 1, SNOWY COTYLEDON 3 n=1 Tax=Hibiscus trionum TaxID=183268 RepID=A0A9W7J8A4_HIBTR|nr:QWRF domain containing 1, SNOWY COTYLEDON 3 [Hibiscus trionum]
MAAKTKTSRFPSPLISRSTNTTPPSTVPPSLPNRSQSVDRRRVSKGNNVNALEASVATKMLVTSMRSLSVSFQREAFSIQTKTRASDHVENSKPVDLQLWPERTQKANSGSNLLSRSSDCDAGKKMFEYTAMMSKSLQRSMMLNESRRVSLSSKKTSGADCVNEPPRVSSSDLEKNSKRRIGSHNITAPEKVRLKTDSPLRRLSVPDSTKFNQSKRISGNGTMSSPIRGGVRPARVGSSVNSTSNVSLSIDVQRKKIREDRSVDAHTLRLLYNRYLQWRFVNAKADASFMVHKQRAEKNLQNASVRTSELRNSVTFNRIKLMLLRQRLKLFSILKGQMAYLEAWAVLDSDMSGSLLGATEALKACTLLLPIVGKASINIESLKDAIGSAVDVTQAMTSSISSLSSKVEEMSSLMDELVNVSANEKALLQQCKNLLSMLAANQVKESWSRTRLIQLNLVSNSDLSVERRI